MRLLRSIGILSALWLGAPQALAYDCSGAASYSDGSPYSNGAVVIQQNQAYQCSVGGWCSVGGPYAPGDGWAWAHAWTRLGACDGNGAGVSSSSASSAANSSSSVASSSSSTSSTPTGGGNCPAWSAAAEYATGDVVTYSGSYYIAEHANPGYNPTVSTWFWNPTSSCPGGNGSGSSSSVPSGGGSGFSAIVSEAQFNQMFPNRNSFYSYAGLVNAAATFPAFATSGNLTTQKREAAAALANFSHETGGLYYINEIAKGTYCSGRATACGVCAPGKKYYGRGPIQLSWNYNYCTAGQALGLDLWSNPDQVAQNPTTAWRTALWFWMTQSGAGHRSAHSSMVNGQGFGETIRTINGSLECNGGNPGQVQSRINTYQTFTQILGTSPGSNLDC
jgi:predicted chitinase